jgi:hypothetical protein
MRLKAGFQVSDFDNQLGRDWKFGIERIQDVYQLRGISSCPELRKTSNIREDHRSDRDGSRLPI